MVRWLKFDGWPGEEHAPLTHIIEDGKRENRWCNLIQAVVKLVGSDPSCSETGGI